MQRISVYIEDLNKGNVFKLGNEYKYLVDIPVPAEVLKKLADDYPNLETREQWSLDTLELTVYTDVYHPLFKSLSVMTQLASEHLDIPPGICYVAFHAGYIYTKLTGEKYPWEQGA